MRATVAETMRKRQACHDLKAQGKSQREIQEAVNVSRAAVRDWLAQSRPTDAAIADALAAAANPNTDATGQVGFKSRFDPELFAQLRTEADLQGAPTNKVLGCALRLYLDCMSRARAGGEEPVDLWGWRA